MNDSISLEKLGQRRKELTESAAREIDLAESKEREAAEHRANSNTLSIRLEEVEYLLNSTGLKSESENVIPMRKSQEQAIKPSLRYRMPGATTDIVAMVYKQNGADYDMVITAVYEKYKADGTSRETVQKMVYRMIKEGYAIKEKNRLYLTDICQKAWEASPLYKAS